MSWMSSCTPGGRNRKYNSLNKNTRYSRLGGSIESLGRDFCVCGGGGRGRGSMGEAICLENV